MTPKTKKIIIDQNKCIGCNTCALLDPNHFELDQETYKAKVKKQPQKITKDIQNTITSCPVGAITLQ